MIRREKARIVSERVAARIREVSAVGLGNWDLAFELVAEPSDAFMDALREWEANDCPTTRSKLEATSAALISAWAEAARQWNEVGRPTLCEPNLRAVEAGVGDLVS